MLVVDGQTGSGKTYTMFGNDGDIRGIIPRSVEYLFQQLAKKSNSAEVAMVCSFLEIYNDQIRDLGKAYLVAMGVESSNSVALYEKTSDIFENLAGKRGNPYFAPAFHRPGSAVASSAENRPGLKEVQDEFNTMNYEIREDNEGNVFVKDLSLVPVTTMEEVMSLISMGLRVRATHETKMNAVSSRSHTVFTITILQRDKITGQSITGMLNLVDLAGSERLKKSESQGIRLKEALHINTSLTALGKVIMALDPSSENTHIPYRDSKLTRVLQNSLGGNSFTSVIAAIHPSPKYYEECLSTLQFANRCRNVRNNPRVNYVDDTEDKDRKIRKLTEELAVMRNKFSQSSTSKGGAGEAAAMSPNKIISLLKAMGINATLSADGAIMVNGKKFTLDDLGVEGGAGGEGSTTSTSHDAAGGRHGKDSSNVSTDKLQKQIKELKESNETYSMRAKERKGQVEEQAREIQKLSAELVKCRTTIKHKEFEYTNLLEEKERSVGDLKKMMEAKHKDEIEAILKANQDLIRQQQTENEKIPQAVKEYTTLRAKIEKQKVSIEAPLRTEFDAHLKHVDKSRLDEIENIKKQYQHFLDEKDKALSGFVESFNAYRAKKAEQLTMAEREIVRLYDYTEQLETILDNVEKGKYQIKQKQGQKGKSTTGIMGMSGVPGTAGGEEQGPGAVMLPKGLRPINPLKITPAGGSSGLELTKKIVEKHKERVAKLDKMKEDAFQKSLHYAAQTGATATGSVDGILKEQVRGLLVEKSPRGNNRNSSPHKQPPKSADEGGRESPDGNFPESNNGSRKNLRAATTDLSRPNSFYNNPEVVEGPSFKLRSTAPGGLQAKPLNEQDEWAESRPYSAQYGLPEELMQELADLREKVKNEQLTTQKVLNDISTNETFVYIQKLETETERLRKQLKDVTNQLQSVKVSFYDA